MMHSPIATRKPRTRRMQKREQPVLVLPNQLDEEDEERLMQQVLRTSYEQFVRPRMPISYLNGTSMMKHDPAPERKPHWCHPKATMKASVPIWDRPVTPQSRIMSTRRSAPPSSSSRSRPRTSARSSTGSGSGIGSAAGWSSRSRESTKPSFRTVRNGTSLNMTSFKRLPEGHPQSILYSALFPNMPISHIMRPGSAQFSRVFKHTQQKQRTVPTATLRAGFQPNYRKILMPFEPQDESTFTSTAKREFKDEGAEARSVHMGQADTEFKTSKGEFTTYMRQALIKKVEYYKVGH